jgi:N-acetylmuramoyl-L-alanine amidase
MFLIFIAIVLIIVGMTLFFVKFMLPGARATMADGESYDVVLDAGHGGLDGGAVGVSGSIEKDINLAIAKKLQDYLVKSGKTVLMTRNDDVSLHLDEGSTTRGKKRSDLKERIKIVKESNAKAFVSIHMNTFPQQKYRGLQVFYSQNLPESKAFAEFMQKSINETLANGNRRLAKPAEDTLLLFKEPPIPTALIECGFLSNRNEESLLKSEEYQQKLAEAIGKNLINWIDTQNNNPQAM